MNLFWSEHIKYNGNVLAFLILGRFTSNKIDMSSIYKYFFIKNIMKNATNKHQTEYMEIIASMKVGYKAL